MTNDGGGVSSSLCEQVLAYVSRYWLVQFF